MDESVIQPIKKYGKSVRQGIGEYLEPSARGNEAKRLIEQGNNLFHESVKPFYRQADELFKMPVVPTDQAKAIAQEVIDNRATFGTDSLVKQAEEVLKWPDRITFSKAHTERSNLLAMSRKQKETMNSVDDMYVQKFRQSIDDAMEAGGTSVPEAREGYEAYRTAAQKYK